MLPNKQRGLPPKKLQIQTEKSRQIDRENQLLFQKLLNITTKPRSSSQTPFKTTLNLKNRKDFQQRINDENLKMFDRIKQQTSLYSIKKAQSRSLSKTRVNSSNNIKQTQTQQKLLCDTMIEQNGIIYKIKLIIDGQHFKILATTQQQSYTRVLEMMKTDGLLLLKNVYHNDITKLIENLQIKDKITIKGIQLVDGHGNFEQQQQ